MTDPDGGGDAAATTGEEPGGLRIVTPEPMLRFACNQRGCCCKGWKIAWSPRDVLEIARRTPEDERDALLTDARIRVTPEGVATHIELARDPQTDACRFLTAEERCGIQERMGERVVPRLCRAFPGFGFASDDGGLEVHWDAVCPEVLEQLDESDAPYAIRELTTTPETHDSDGTLVGSLLSRGEHRFPLPRMALGGAPLTHTQLVGLRRAAVAQLADATTSPVAHLAGLSVAIADAVQAGETTLTVPDAAPVEAFDAFMDLCVEAHSPAALARNLRIYQRFVFTLPVGEVDETALLDALAYRDDWRDRVRPDAPEHAPLLRRYLAHRFWMAFDRGLVPGALSFAWGGIPHGLGTAFRVADALGRALDRPVGRDALKIGIGAAEYLLRNLRIPAESMPWFGFEPPPDPRVQ